MMKAIGDRRNAREEKKEVVDGVKKESKLSCTADNETKKGVVEVKEITVVSAAIPVVTDPITMGKKDKKSDEMQSSKNDMTIIKSETKKMLVSEDNTTSTSTADNQILSVKKEEQEVEEKKVVEEEEERTEVDIEAEAEAEVVMKFEKMKVSLKSEGTVISESLKVCHDTKQNPNKKLNAEVSSNYMSATESTDLVLLSSKVVVAVEDTLPLPSTAQVQNKAENAVENKVEKEVENEVEDAEGKVNAKFNCLDSN